MSIETGQDGGNPAVARRIAARRQDLETDIETRQKEVKNLNRLTRKARTQHNRARARLEQRKAAVRTAEQAVKQHAQELEAAMARAGQAQASVDVERKALADFDRGLQGLLGGPVTGRRRTASRRASGGITLGQTLLAVMQEDRGMAVSEILNRVEEQFGRSIKRTSAGTTLSVLRRKGLTARNQDGWLRVAATGESGESGDGESGDAPEAGAS